MPEPSSLNPFCISFKVGVGVYRDVSSREMGAAKSYASASLYGCRADIRPDIWALGVHEPSTLNRVYTSCKIRVGVYWDV